MKTSTRLPSIPRSILLAHHCLSTEALQICGFARWSVPGDRPTDKGLRRGFHSLFSFSCRLRQIKRSVPDRSCCLHSVAMKGLLWDWEEPQPKYLSYLRLVLAFGAAVFTFESYLDWRQLKVRWSASDCCCIRLGVADRDFVLVSGHSETSATKDPCRNI